MNTYKNLFLYFKSPDGDGKPSGLPKKEEDEGGEVGNGDD